MMSGRPVLAKVVAGVIPRRVLMVDSATRAAAFRSVVYSRSMKPWNKSELIVALGLYCQIPFGKIHSKNPAIIKAAAQLERTPSALAMKMLNFASLDPSLRERGRSGLGNASKLDEEVWREFEGDWHNFASNYDALAQSIEPDLLIQEKEAYEAEDVPVAAKRRKHQSFFRVSVLANYESSCCMSGISDPRLLVAGHIVPWSVDRSNRLNPRNGLCLSVLHHHLFDLGLITVTTKYTILVSSSLLTEATDRFSRDNLHALNGQTLRPASKFSPSVDFLDYHLNHVFKGA